MAGDKALRDCFSCFCASIFASSFKPTLTGHQYVVGRRRVLLGAWHWLLMFQHQVEVRAHGRVRIDRNESKVLADLLPAQLHELVDHGFEQAQRLELLPLILGGRMVGQELVDVEEEEVDVKQATCFGSWLCMWMMPQSLSTSTCQPTQPEVPMVRAKCITGAMHSSKGK